jgi:mRNA-degrading endonuclease RelE of RelBE toxin-antitoxin system
VPRRQKFELVFAPETVEHVKAIDSEHHSLIRTTIEERLKMAPGTPTRNRKRLETPEPFDATWELRFGSDNRFRVFYEIDEVTRTVNILAIGIKDRTRLLIGGKEFK